MKKILLTLTALSVLLILFITIKKDDADEAMEERIEEEMEEMAHKRPGYPSELAMWQYEQRAYPNKEIPEGWREAALNHIEHQNLKLSKMVSNMNWVSLGPGNVGGRIRSIIIDYTDNQVLYAGSVGGGVWKTTNGGLNWFALKDNMENLAVCSLVMDPRDHNTIYAGTGEGFNNVDAIRGAGIFKTTDAGATWTQLSSTKNSVFYYVNCLRIDSVNNVLYAATNMGLYKSTNGGAQFTQAVTSTYCSDVEIGYTDPVTIYAATSSDSKLYISNDAGKTFTYRTNTGFARTEIAVSESDPAVAYISMANQSDSKIGKMQVTGNAGKTWTDIVIPGGTETYTAGQAWYNNIMAVHPLYSKILYAGGLDIYKSTNSGSAWTKKSYWYNDQSSPQFVHADNHALVFDPKDPKVIYAGNDGGIFKSTNLGDSWISLNNGLCVTQFYYGAVDPGANSTKYYGGTQDNGTIKTDNSPNGWYAIGGGDGGSTEVDYVTPNVVYHEYINLQISKSTTGGGNAAICMNGIPTASGKTGTTDRTEFISPFIIDPNNHNILLAGTYKIYKTTNQAAQWAAISGDLSTDGRSNVSAIGVAHGNSNVIYAGYSNGVIQATTDNGKTWNKGVGLPNAYCKRIITDYNDTAIAYAVYSGYSTYSKVFRSTNYGQSWINITGDLPNIPVNCIQVNPNDRKNIVIGTDLGIFVTENGGTNWIKNNNGLANVRVEDLDYRISDNKLFASTHGRGMFMASFNTVGVEEQKNIPVDYALYQNYPNPFNPETNIKYQLKRGSSVRVTIYNAAGQEIKELVNSYKDAGTYTVRWDGRNVYGNNVSSGVYLYKISAGNFSETKKMVLMR